MFGYGSFQLSARERNQFNYGIGKEDDRDRCVGYVANSIRKHLAGELWVGIGQNISGQCGGMVVCRAGGAEYMGNGALRGARWHALAWDRWRWPEPFRRQNLSEVQHRGWFAFEPD